MEIESIFCSFVAALVVALITFFITKSWVEKKYQLDFEVKKNYLVDDARRTTIGGGEVSARLENEYLRGVEDGRKSELEKFAITYEPYEEVIEEYLGIKRRVEVGYDMQLFYSGLPVGDSTRKVTHKNVEFDEKKLEKMMNNDVVGALNNLTQMMLTRGISSKVLPRKRRVAS